MIHISFEGGLGNQMFQYSFGRYLQDKFHEEVVIDISKYKYEKIEYRNFELSSFNIAKWDFDKTYKSRLSRYGIGYILYLAITWIYLKTNKKKKNIRFANIYQKVINIFGFYRVHFGEYIEPRNSITKNKYIRGMWFCPDIVEKMDIIIRKELRVITPISKTNKDFLSQIQNCNSVAVHIRRGDYVNLGLIICDIPYYKRCMDKMATLVEILCFLSFQMILNGSNRI